MDQKVVVLMVTYNGEKYLRAQIESITKQTYGNVRLFVLDNGSQDKTWEILKEFERADQIHSLKKAENLEPSKAFLQLLDEAPDNCFVAFSDQDDVWLPEKIETLILNCQSNKPTVTFSSRSFTTENGTLLGESKEIDAKLVGWKNACIENIIPGNTLLLNPEAVKLLKEIGIPDVKHYDSWIYLVMSVFGNLQYIPRPLVQYRIHDSNAVGLRGKTPRKIPGALSNYLKQNSVLFQKINKLNRVDANQDFVKFQESFLGSGRLLTMNLFLRSPIYRMSKIETFITKLLLVFRTLLNKDFS